MTPGYEYIPLVHHLLSTRIRLGWILSTSSKIVHIEHVLCLLDRIDGDRNARPRFHERPLDARGMVAVLHVIPSGQALECSLQLTAGAKVSNLPEMYSSVWKESCWPASCVAALAETSARKRQHASFDCGENPKKVINADQLESPNGLDRMFTSIPNPVCFKQRGVAGLSSSSRRLLIGGCFDVQVPWSQMLG